MRPATFLLTETIVPSPARLLVLLITALTACSPLPVINALVPAETYKAERDIAYGPDPRNRLDVYMPANRPEKAPVIVFFYGGNWNSGSRGDYLFAGEAFASQGFVAVVADYRLYPQVKFPEFIYDSAQAFAWAHKNIAHYGGDPQRMFLAGHSAGAYNAAMLAYNPDYLKGVGIDLSAVKGFIGLAGPYDFLPLTGNLTKEVFGFPDTSPATQPISFVPTKPGARLVPALLLTAPADQIVNPGNSLRMAAKLRAAGGSAREIAYPELDHARMVGALAAPLRKRFGPVLEDIAAWVRQTP
jgi:acetyl esterase/lipase